MANTLIQYFFPFFVLTQFLKAADLVDIPMATEPIQPCPLLWLWNPDPYKATAWLSMFRDEYFKQKCNFFFSFISEKPKKQCVCSLVYQADSGELGGGLSISQSKKGDWGILRTLNHSSRNPCILSGTHWLVVLSLLWPQARSAFLGLCVVVSCSGLTDQNTQPKKFRMSRYSLLCACLQSLQGP